MKTSKVFTDNPVFLAPMAGITDIPFRRICREQGCGLVCTEMVSANGMHYKDRKTFQLTGLDEDEEPASIQIFGSDPGIMAEAAMVINSTDASFIDINMGCPTPKITRNGEGAALMRAPVLVERIIKAVVSVSMKPVTVKIRKGWDEESINAVEIARIAEGNGAAAVTVHGRTRSQFFSGKADWRIIRDVKGAVSIPVVGNGDINKPEDARRMMEETECDAVMVGRGALGNPWIFRRIRHYLDTGNDICIPGHEDRMEMIKRHMNLAIAYKGERIGILQMRKHMAWYLKGSENATRVRQQLSSLNKREDVLQLLQSLE